MNSCGDRLRAESTPAAGEPLALCTARLRALFRGLPGKRAAAPVQASSVLKLSDESGMKEKPTNFMARDAAATSSGFAPNPKFASYSERVLRIQISLIVLADQRI